MFLRARLKKESSPRAYDDIYKDGVLASGVSLSNISNTNSRLTYNYSRNTFEEGTSSTAKITFDFTNYKQLVVIGVTEGWSRQGDCVNYLDIDNATTILNTQFLAYNFTKLYDISTLTGSHSIASKIYIKSRTSDGYSYINFYITRIMAYE